MAMDRPRIAGTQRIEAFSDGVLAIIVTLLILEVHLPEVEKGAPTQAMVDAFVAVAPKFASFAVSFFTVAIYWVNHHHFFDRVTHTDWKLLWANNLLLFFLTVVPFMTAVLGDHLEQPLAAAAYALDLGLAAAAFSLMGWYVFFRGRLVDERIPEPDRRVEFRRSLVGTVLYLAGVPLAFVATPLALALFVAIPIFFVVPSLLASNEA